MRKQHILTFLREWLKYSDACMKAHKAGDALPHSQVFRPWYGLCACLHSWGYKKDDPHVSGLDSTLKELFRDDRLCPTYPFGERSFQMRFERDSNCRCPNRRRWVKKTIAKLEQELSDGNH